MSAATKWYEKARAAADAFEAARKAEAEKRTAAAAAAGKDSSSSSGSGEKQPEAAAAANGAQAAEGAEGVPTGLASHAQVRVCLCLYGSVLCFLPGRGVSLCFNSWGTAWEAAMEAGVCL
jgi:hypothetical protein